MVPTMSSWQIKSQSIETHGFKFKFRSSAAGAPKLEIMTYERGVRPLHILVHFNDAGDVLRIERLKVPRRMRDDADGQGSIP